MRGPLPRILSPLTVPLSWAYGGAIAARNARFDRRIGIQRCNRPVISVGNITTGGTGKTPMVAWIARLLLEHECTPVIAMRGYGARPGEISDEQAEYGEIAPGAHIVANPDRVAALREFLPRHPGVTCIILDDGFQHRQIHRDLDLVLIDATAGTLQDRMLPAGNLREPLANLKRADAVIVTHADADTSESEISNLRSQIRKLNGRPPLAWTRHQWTQLTVFGGDGRGRKEAISWLQGKRVVTMLGIGRPHSVIDELSRHGAEVSANIPVADHERYDRAGMQRARRMCEGCDAMIVTGKDWVKLRALIDLEHWPAPIVVPRMELDVFEGGPALRERILATIRLPTAGEPAR